MKNQRLRFHIKATAGLYPLLVGMFVGNVHLAPGPADSNLLVTIVIPLLTALLIGGISYPLASFMHKALLKRSQTNLPSYLSTGALTGLACGLIGQHLLATLDPAWQILTANEAQRFALFHIACAIIVGSYYGLVYWKNQTKKT